MTSKTENISQLFLFLPQIDLLHIHANTTAEGSSDHVEVGIDLSEYYINVEWDILRVPAERHVKVYACCPEPYPGNDYCKTTNKLLSYCYKLLFF